MIGIRYWFGKPFVTLVIAKLLLGKLELANILRISSIIAHLSRALLSIDFKPYSCHVTDCPPIRAYKSRS